MRPDGPTNASTRDALVGALLAESDGNPLVTVGEAARALRVNRGYLYRRAEQLGGVRLGDGPKAPIRFPAPILADRILATSDRSPESHQPPKRSRRRPRGDGADGELLPVRDRFATARPGGR